MSELILKRLTVSNADLMLNGTGTAKLIPFQYKDIMTGQNKVLSHCRILGRPSRFSFSSSFSCCSATDMCSNTDSAPRVASISGDSSAGGTRDAETTLATCTPFFRKIGDSDMFLTTIETLLLLSLSLVYACMTCSPGGRGHTPSG